MKRTGRVIFALIFSFLLLSASGCWDYLEYENMAQVETVGIDFNKTTKEVTMTIEYLQTGKGGGGSGGGKDSQSKPSSSQQAVVRSAIDWTTSGAMEKLQQGIGKRLFLGYMRLNVISEEAAKYIMKDIMQVSDRAQDIRATANLVITAGKAQDVMSTSDPDISIPPGMAVSDMLAMTRGTGAAFPVSIQDFNEMLAIGGLEAVAPRIITTVTPPSAVDQKSVGSTGADGSTGSAESDGVSGQTIISPKPKDGHHWIEGMAVFKEAKMVGWLNREESLGLGLLTGKKIRNYKIVNHSVKSDFGNKLIYQIIGSGSKIKPRLVQGKPVFEVNVKVEVSLRKYLDSPDTKYLRPDLIRSLEKELAASVAVDLRGALRKGQKDLKSDIFGFGFAFYRKYPHLWRSKYKKKWSKIFPDIPVHLKVQAKVSNTGTNIRQLIIK